MNARTLVLIVVALVIAVAAALLARSFLSDRAAPPPTEQADTGLQVLVAAKPLPIGHFVVPEDLRWQTWPPGSLSPNYVKKAGGADRAFHGKVVRHGITVGEPITAARIVGPGQRGYMAAVLKPGMRAITIGMGNVGGFVFPGDRVDLMLTRQVTDGAGRKRTITETVVRNIRILAVDLSTNDQQTKPRRGKAITIEVSPKLAEKMSILRRLGRLSITLRSLQAPDGEPLDSLNIDDTFPIDTQHTVTWDAETTPLIPPVDEERHTQKVVISNGGRQRTLKFKKAAQ